MKPPRLMSLPCSLVPSYPMALKSLKATISIQSGSLDDAIVFLSQRFLRATATGCRVVQTPTEVCAADVCQPLIDGWMGGQVGYGKGKIE